MKFKTMNNKLYTNTYEKFLVEKYEETQEKWRESVKEIEKLNEEISNLKITLENERRLHKLELEQIKVK